MPILPVNLNGVQPNSRENLPPGEYILQVDGASIETNKDGVTQRLSVKNKVVIGPGQATEHVGKTVFSSYNLDPKNAGFLMRFVIACELQNIVAQNGGAIDSDWFTGRQYYAKLSVKNDYQNVGNERSLAAAPTGPAGVPQAPPAGMQQPGMMQPQGFMQPPPVNAPQMAPQMQGGYPPQGQQQYQPPMQQQWQQPQQPQQPQAPQQGFGMMAPPPPPGTVR